MIESNPETDEIASIDLMYHEVQEMFKDLNALPANVERAHALRRLSEIEFWLEIDLDRMRSEPSEPE